MNTKQCINMFVLFCLFVCLFIIIIIIVIIIISSSSSSSKRVISGTPCYVYGGGGSV